MSDLDRLPTASPHAMPELWGGMEYSIVRIGDGYRDQATETGHWQREGDLAAFAALGLRRIRYPVLWESLGDDPDEGAWARHDHRVGELRRLGLPATAGLLHHGSGLPDTSLLDTDFPERLARHAGRVAARYPWIDSYTPVNEPLTTARFSALYGHWYPHRADAPSFYRALVNQCRATVLAMAAIRRVNPAARLVQTEEVGRTFSTPRLAYQADHDNARRWLSLDLLCGRVDRSHPWFAVLRNHGIDEAELDAFVAEPTPPDIIGINYYLTSDRFLDERLGRYPSSTHGGNGRDAYADVEAVRIESIHPNAAIGPRIREIWDRYHLPIAITEVHNGCTREEQLRWLAEIWSEAMAAKRQGIDLRAVTIWSLLGAFDWNSLLVRNRQAYEVGAFDIRGEALRPTALAGMAAALARAGSWSHPVLAVRGWWHREDRFFGAQRRLIPFVRPSGACIMITGATGTLGIAIARACVARRLPHVLLSRAEAEIADPASVAAAIARHRPWAIINAAGFVRVADADLERERCFRENVQGPANLAEASRRAGIPLVTFSSDLVFDGQLGRPYVEDDETQPQGAYGESKAEAERRVLAAHRETLVVRTSAFFGPADRYNFLVRTLAALAERRPVRADGNVVVSPTYVPHLADTVLDLLIDGATGLWHLANRGAVSWADFARQAAAQLGIPDDCLVEGASPKATATVLASRHGGLLPSLEEAISAFVEAAGPEILSRRRALA